MIDCIIVGGGISGICLAFQLISNDKTFEIYNTKKLPGASKIAAGIYNPLLPKHQKIAYNAANIYPTISNFYSKIETFTSHKFHSESPIHYIFNSIAEQNDWSILLENEKFSPFAQIKPQSIVPYIEAPFGFLSINYSGRIDTLKLIESVHNEFTKMNVLKNMFFEESNIKYHLDYIEYNGTKARSIIFCQGNHSFFDLKLKPAKGEVLTIKCNSEFNDIIPQQGVFMATYCKNTYKVGSTFEWQNLDSLPTAKGKNEILEKFNHWYSGSYEIIDHIAGVRPSSHDRRPLLGKIPNRERCYIFNGLGSKGIALAPYYSEMLIKNILNNAPIDADVDVKRIFK